MRFPDGYYENLARIKEVFPDKEVLRVEEVVRFTGKDRRTIVKYLPVHPKFGISVATLARCLADRDYIKV